MREGMLDELLRDASSSEQPRPSKRARTDIGGARDALDAFCTGEAAREVARGPVLLGVAALLRAQGAHPSELQAWACERAVLLNGGQLGVGSPTTSAPLVGERLPPGDAAADAAAWDLASPATSPSFGG